jgi:uncharacterized protein with NRDE domain
MCLVLVALDRHPEYSLIVAANRDEFYDRPAAPAAFWADAPSVLAGRDLQAGGTWLGVDRQGRFAAVTNYRQGRRESPAPRSRGRLVSDFLTAAIPTADYLRRVARDAHLYAGFNLLAGQRGELHYFSNRDGPPRTLAPGVYGLSNHLLDTPWPKVRSAKSALGALWHRRGPELTADLLALLADRTRPPDESLPRTSVGREWERLLSSAFILSGEYGTRSSTVVLVGRDGDAEFLERGFGPGGAPAGVARFTFPLEPLAQARPGTSPPAAD